jgi:Rrf2 family transcriptional regulator, nitric oxide-sensitive transcriptional repressor
MRLTAYTDYTLRTLMYLEVNVDRPATIAEIADAHQISQTHLMKVAHRLGVAGDVETIRGRNGGMRLARPAASINLGAIVRRTEADMALVPCFGDGRLCAISGPCRLRTALREALVAFLAVLDRYSLADLVAPRRRLASLLGIESSRDPGSVTQTGLLP